MICEFHTKRYCCEDISQIENYDKAVADKTHMWCCHHRAEVLPCGEYTVKDLKQNGLYLHRPAAELIFLTRREHRMIHAKNGYEAACKGGLKVKDTYWWNNGLANRRSAECPGEGWVRGMLDIEDKAKQYWWNDGTQNKRSNDCPGEGWKRGCLKKGH